MQWIAVKPSGKLNYNFKSGNPLNFITFPMKKSATNVFLLRLSFPALQTLPEHAGHISGASGNVRLFFIIPY